MLNYWFIISFNLNPTCLLFIFGYPVYSLYVYIFFVWNIMLCIPSVNYNFFYFCMYIMICVWDQLGSLSPFLRSIWGLVDWLRFYCLWLRDWGLFCIPFRMKNVYRSIADYAKMTIRFGHKGPHLHFTYFCSVKQFNLA